LAKLIFLLGIFFLYWQNLYFLLAKLFSLGKTYISSWIFLAKPIFLIGKAYISSWQIFSLLAKHIFLFG